MMRFGTCFNRAAFFAIATASALFTAPGSAATEVPLHSRNFSTPLSNEACSALASEIVITKAGQVKNENLQLLIQAISTECGLGTPDPDLNFAPQAFAFQGSDLFLMWDGHTVSIGNTARANIQFTQPASFRTSLISRQDVDPSQPDSFMSSLANHIQSISDRLRTIFKDGEGHLLVSGYTFHDPGSYTAADLAKLNSHAWGIGYERVIESNENGNREAVQAIIFSDSHRMLEPGLSYEWLHPFRISNIVAVWAGYSAGLTARSDIYSYTPIPYVIPTAALSIGKIQLKGIFIPKIGGQLNHGNVAWFYASVPVSDL